MQCTLVMLPCMAIIYNVISFCKDLGHKWKRILQCTTVTVAVTATVLLVVGSVLSTLNGKYTCLSISIVM